MKIYMPSQEKTYKGGFGYLGMLIGKSAQIELTPDTLDLAIIL